MEVYFLTHTSTKIMDGVPIENWELSNKGRLQAERLKLRIASLGISKVICSQEIKARETAEIVTKGLGMNVFILPGLQEVHRVINKILPLNDFIDLCIRYLDGIGSLGWEDRYTAQKRLMESLYSIIKVCDDKDVILVVGHGLAGILVECAVRNVPIGSKDHINQLKDGSGKYIHYKVGEDGNLFLVDEWQ